MLGHESCIDQRVLKSRFLPGRTEFFYFVRSRYQNHTKVYKHMAVNHADGRHMFCRSVLHNAYVHTKPLLSGTLISHLLPE